MRPDAGGSEPRLILDPFALYREGEAILRAELDELEPEQLRNMAASFAIASPEISSTLTGHELRQTIIAAARRHAARESEGGSRA